MNMLALKALLLGALATTASASYFNGEALRREVLQVRATPASTPVATVITRYPTATASTNSSNACNSVIQGLATLITGLPTPTGDLYSYLQTAATTLTDPCVSNSHNACHCTSPTSCSLPKTRSQVSNLPLRNKAKLTSIPQQHITVPSSIAPAFSVYESSIVSFYSAHKSQINSALSSCPSLTKFIANPVCSTSPSASTASIVKTIPPSTPTATTTKTGTGNGSATGASSTPSISVVSKGGASAVRGVSGIWLLLAGVEGVVVALL
jgi:hypothetical protein